LEEVLVSFFAILEMIKRHMLIAVQKQMFGPILIWSREEEDRAMQKGDA
jgi:chromatin segregation and condensation protein Rec8/ScpA/Scc1 (kleisin family)